MDSEPWKNVNIHWHFVANLDTNPEMLTFQKPNGIKFIIQV